MTSACKAPCLAFLISLSYFVSDDPYPPFIVYGPFFIYGLFVYFIYNKFRNYPIWVAWELGHVFLKLISLKPFSIIEVLYYLYPFYRFSEFKGKLFLLNAFNFISKF